MLIPIEIVEIHLLNNAVWSAIFVVGRLALLHVTGQVQFTQYRVHDIFSGWRATHWQAQGVGSRFSPGQQSP
jgi:hypothetical protein